MTCDEIQGALVAYCFGDISEEERARVEEHLLGCRPCLERFFALKRDIETASGSPAPSPSSALRLRRAVAAELGLAAPRKAWSWWERPLAFGFAGAAVVAILVSVKISASGPAVAPHSLGTPAAVGSTFESSR
jgi:anti-sigma factor RsiW